jgi:hypothetical protein
VFNSNFPWIHQHKSFALCQLVTTNQSLIDQLFSSLPYDVLFRYCDLKIQVKSFKNYSFTSSIRSSSSSSSILVTSSRKTVEVMRQLHECYCLAFFPTEIKTKQSTDYKKSVRFIRRAGIISLLSSAYHHLHSSAIHHLTKFQFSSLTKVGILCLISGGLQSHFTSLDCLLIKTKLIIQQAKEESRDDELDSVLASSCSFEAITSLLLGYNMIYRAILHIEAICIKGKHFQKDINLSFCYFLETFILSNGSSSPNTMGLPLGLNGVGGISSTPLSKHDIKYYYLSKEIIFLFLHINPLQCPKVRNTFLYFMSFYSFEIFFNIALKPYSSRLLSEFTYFVTNSSRDILSSVLLNILFPILFILYKSNSSSEVINLLFRILQTFHQNKLYYKLSSSSTSRSSSFSSSSLSGTCSTVKLKKSSSSYSSYSSFLQQYHLYLKYVIVYLVRCLKESVNDRSDNYFQHYCKLYHLAYVNIENWEIMKNEDQKNKAKYLLERTLLQVKNEIDEISINEAFQYFKLSSYEL